MSRDEAELAGLQVMREACSPDEMNPREDLRTVTPRRLASNGALVSRVFH